MKLLPYRIALTGQSVVALAKAYAVKLMLHAMLY